MIFWLRENRFMLKVVNTFKKHFSEEITSNTDGLLKNKFPPIIPQMMSGFRVYVLTGSKK